MTWTLCYGQRHGLLCLRCVDVKPKTDVNRDLERVFDQVNKGNLEQELSEFTNTAEVFARQSIACHCSQTSSHARVRNSVLRQRPLWSLDSTEMCRVGELRIYVRSEPVRTVIIMLNVTRSIAKKSVDQALVEVHCIEI